jgi:hypothetical protein
MKSDNTVHIGRFDLKAENEDDSNYKYINFEIRRILIINILIR